MIPMLTSMALSTFNGAIPCSVKAWGIADEWFKGPNRSQFVTSALFFPFSPDCGPFINIDAAGDQKMEGKGGIVLVKRVVGRTEGKLNQAVHEEETRGAKTRHRKDENNL